MKERLQKILSARGVASRRASEQMITDGRVMVNGRIALLGESADADVDEILADGAGKNFPQQGIIFIGFILRHHPGGPPELADDLFVVIYIAAVDGGDVALLPADMTAQLADFLIVHGYYSLCKNIAGVL